MPTDSIPTLSTGAIAVVRPSGSPAPSDPGRTDRARAIGIAAQIASSMVSQSGAAVASSAIAAIGAPAVVAVRQLLAAAVLLPVVRPTLRGLPRRTLGAVLVLGIATLTMNLGLYTAIDRLGLALAVTLEFLGPLAVAVGGARRVKDVVAAALALVGVIVLVRPSGTTDWFGVGAALLGAASWAVYILLNRDVGRRLPGLRGAALSASVGGVLAVPALVAFLTAGVLTVDGVLLACVAGLLCSVVPMVADLFALRRVPARVFGVLASINPVAAALSAIVFLHELPTVVEAIGIGVIVTANVIATVERRRRPVATPART